MGDSKQQAPQEEKVKGDEKNLDAAAAAAAAEPPNAVETREKSNGVEKPQLLPKAAWKIDIFCMYGQLNFLCDLRLLLLFIHKDGKFFAVKSLPFLFFRKY